MVNVFAVPVFFICFRECLETSIIVSVLLSFLKQTLGPQHDEKVYKKLVRQVWLGVGLGLVICLIVGAGMIGAFYGIGKNYFALTEDLWEGIFALFASLIITLMGAALLRVSKLQDKWRVKIAKAIEAKDTATGVKLSHRIRRWTEKYAMFVLPFITVLREGLEAIVFIGGVGLGMPASAFPLAVICGLLAGVVAGYLIYRGGNHASLQIFLIISTCFLYLVAAGLFSKSIWYLQNREWNKIVGGDAAEVGTGPGSYDIRRSVWHVNCCGPEIGGGGGWGVFNSLFGWQNSATYGSVISYNVYWLAVIVGFLALGFNEKYGHWPFLKAKAGTADDSSSDTTPPIHYSDKGEATEGTVREVR
ncbi:plasma membrane iron permease-like protein [Trichodelitschia bisporula]|uniref:Plasma membrane iron permease-like protein n=1 Tax=Trichodelitschia bisporula TaxID=703511 RepID=A0A6G1HKN8_9PEZI|nr:plasma membrane iron permease-like protein [Trichodelitschia bisporula]